VIGFYDPKTKPATVKIDKEILNAWLKKGAQLTPAVKKLLS
jgi:ribosomal protein S16